jgi:hypothetical protein
LALLLSAPGSALAQDVASAEALFRAGRDLMDRGDYAAACPKLAESYRLDPSSGTILNLALCHAKQGKTATAWAEFLVAARLARQQQRQERVDEATRQAEALEKTLSHLTITVKAPIAGLGVQRDDVRLEPSSVGVRLPADPGKHVITVTAPGRKAMTIEITLGAASDDQTIAVPPLEPDAATLSSNGVPDAGPARPARGPLPWVVGGVGVAALGVGATFGGLALSTYSTAKSECPTKSGCSDDALSTRSRANTFANVANVGIPVGAAAVGVAVMVLLTSRAPEPPKDAPPRAVLIPVCGPHHAGLSLSGVFR